jgi:NAD(P) transhydrogenase
MSSRYDLIVIGAGPAGWGAALQGAKLGLSVLVVDRGAMIGGACVHTGTIPSKALRETVIRLMNVRRSAQLGLRSVRTRRFSVRDLMGPTDALVHHHADTVQSFFERNQVELVRGTATFLSPKQIRVATGGELIHFEAERVIIASGSKPRRPDTIPFDDRIICDSDSILSIDAIPRSMAVLGGGVIGCEYACIFATLGVKVTLVDRRETLLRFLDREILDALHHRMRRMGVRLLLGEEVASVRLDTSRREPQGAIELKSGRVVRCDRLLAAAGREPCTEHLDLARAGVQIQQNGEIKVDEFYRTSAEGVYAVGDVIGFPALAGTSMHQGRVATLHAHGREVQAAPDLPLAVYTIPEISMVGLTEDACRTRGIVYEVGVARYGEIPRGQICGDTEGLLKIVFRREDHVVLGVHLIGEGSSELVHFGMALVHAGGRIDQLATAVFNYPTLSEAYRIAALDGLNRL